MSIVRQLKRPALGEGGFYLFDPILTAFVRFDYFCHLGAAFCIPREVESLIAVFSLTATDDSGLKLYCSCAHLFPSVGFSIV